MNISGRLQNVDTEHICITFSDNAFNFFPYNIRSFSLADSVLIATKDFFRFSQHLINIKERLWPALNI